MSNLQTCPPMPTMAPTAKPDSIYAKLNPDQLHAVDSILAFLKPDNPERFFLLQGFAGTGKTFCLQAVIEKFNGRMVFTAPTNKATKVLRDTMTKDNYKPECRTIYSLLGLRLEANGEVKELAVPEDPLDLSQYRAVCLDEGSMVNNLVFKFVKEAAELHNLKFIVMADYAQLPPVGEQSSPTKKIELGATLSKVMRYDNQILKLATAIRSVVDHPAPIIKLLSDNNGEEGIWYEPARDIENRIIDAAGQGYFSKADCAKAIAWRNVTVDHLNTLIRNKIFDFPLVPWLPGDRVILLEPANDLDGERVGSTDDEGVINSATIGEHPMFPEFMIWNLSVTLDDNRMITLRVLHETCNRAHATRVERLAVEARANRKLWPQFWNFKDSFHKVRHSYAITAHRSQGSTYEMVFVNWRDILLNQNRQEAFRCLYVACTRPKKKLYLG